MKTLALQSWREVRDEIIRRIQQQIWQPDELIPKEVDLANEFNCTRVTVNRALRDLADEGILDRRRKGGTRVLAYPVRKAKLDISITRQQVEQRGSVYRHTILEQQRATPPPLIRSHLKLDNSADMLHLRTLHFADNQPFLYEDRWINLSTVPEILNADLSEVSANEWLVKNVPLTTGDITFSAVNASAEQAEHLSIAENQAIFIIDRATWVDEQSITYVQLFYAPGFQMSTTI